MDVDQDSVIDFSGLDRVTQTVRDVTTISSVNVRRTRTYQLAFDNSSTTLLVNESRDSTDGLQSWNIAFGLTTQSVTTVNTGTGARTTTVTHPDNSTTVSVYSFGRLQTVTRKNSGGTQIAKSTHAYDPHGRVLSVTDARNGATVYTYGAGDAVATVTTPAPGTGGPAQTTTSLYDTLGRAWKTVLADGTSTTNEFFLTGQLRKTYGSRSYPVEYTYDPAGRMKTMKTWQNFMGNSGTAVTTWNYHTTRGWLLSKGYANAATGAAGTTGPDYTYTAGNRLKTRTWAREYSAGSRIVTTYKYGFDDASGGNSHGDLTEVSYNDGVTATVGYGYDRRGRQIAVTQGGNTTTRFYLDAGPSLGERYSGGTLSGLNITNSFDAYLRRSTVCFRNGTTAMGASTYGYDTASRLASVTDGPYSATYTYQNDSSLVDTLTFKTSGSTRLTTQKRYDRLDRLQSIASTPSAMNQAVPFFTYEYNDANQRTRVTLGDGSYSVYDYDSLGQVKAGKRYWSDGTPVAGQQFEYGFDDIGNRTNSKRGGDENGASLREIAYARNYLNQQVGRTNLANRYADVLGLATFNQSSPASVIVNGQAAYRRGEYWRAELNLGTGNAVWQSVVVNVGTMTNTGNLFVSPTPVIYTYDLDGNLTADGRWTYTWDAENRLIAMESLTHNPSGSKRKLAFEYDAQSRRIGKKVYVWNGSAYPGTASTTLKFLYDGWNVLAELDSSNVVVRSYQWGTDLSGSLEGAGGVGGLLSVKPAGASAQFVVCDGNGNTMALVDGSSGALSASYEYSPLGELLRASGSEAANPIRFSSKYHDVESELAYYGYRYFCAATGGWLSRDPIDESGGENLYIFNHNDSVNNFDVLGLAWDVKRTTRLDRAHVKPGVGDTVQQLAILIGLDDKDFKKWLIPVGPSKLPQKVTDPINDCSEYTIPNTIYIEFGSMYKTLDPLGPIPKWRKFFLNQKDAWEGSGFRVVVTDPSNPDTARAHLKDKNIWGFVYAGHGGGEGKSVGLLTFLNGEGTTTLDGGKISPHGINFVYAYACNTALPSPNTGTRLATEKFLYSPWERNVATRGFFHGITGEASGWSAWSMRVSSPGTNP